MQENVECHFTLLFSFFLSTVSQCTIPYPLFLYFHIFIYFSVIYDLHKFSSRTHTHTHVRTHSVIHFMVLIFLTSIRITVSCYAAWSTIITLFQGNIVYYPGYNYIAYQKTIAPFHTTIHYTTLHYCYFVILLYYYLIIRVINFNGTVR